MGNRHRTHPGEAILDAARELRAVAAVLGAPYLVVHLHAADGELVALTVEDDGVTLTGRGFEKRLALGERSL